MIRDKIYKEIVAIIDRHNRFDSYDFRIVSNDSTYNTLLSITYKIEPKYEIVFKIPSSPTVKAGHSDYYEFSGTVCPGPLSYFENFDFKGQNIIYNKIDIWLNCIWEELTANPFIKLIEDQQTQIDEIFEKFEALPDEYFTKSEADDLKSRLDELEKSLEDQAKKHTIDKELLKEELISLHNDIETLKLTVSSLKKNGWLKSFTGKIFKWTNKSENRELLKGGYEFIKGFLPENIKGDLP